jgi:hypothetical protein
MKAIDRFLFFLFVFFSLSPSALARLGRPRVLGFWPEKTHVLLERRSPKAQNSHGLTGRCVY